LLSKKERDYLLKNVDAAKSYERVLKHRIREKLKQFFCEMYTEIFRFLINN